MAWPAFAGAPHRLWRPGLRRGYWGQVAGKGPGLDWDVEVDCEGMLCPLPVLRARKRLMALAPGQHVLLRATDPMAAIDLPHFCQTEGHDLLEVRTEGPVSLYLIRRGASSPVPGADPV